MSAVTLSKNIKRIANEPVDFSLFYQKESSLRIKKELESSAVVTTIPASKIQNIENLIDTKKLLISKRNTILDNLFKYYNPYYRRKLKEIDAKLDELDLQLYIFESEFENTEANLDRAIKSAKEKLTAISEKSIKKNF